MVELARTKSTPGTEFLKNWLFLFRVEGLLFIELAIALVSSGVDLAPIECVLDGAGGFVGVRAIGEPAMGDEGTELDEMAVELTRNSAP